jgi:anaerobic selenocysteine-containing dehydrogenase
MRPLRAALLGLEKYVTEGSRQELVQRYCSGCTARCGIRSTTRKSNTRRFTQQPTARTCPECLSEGQGCPPYTRD